jgi:hypothetical protein
VKIVDLSDASLEGCVTEAQRERVVIVRDGKPVGERRREKTVSRAELEEKIRADGNQ